MRAKPPRTPGAIRRSASGSSGSPWRCGIAWGLAAWLVSGSAFAHIELVYPPARYGPEHQKTSPCGHADNPPGQAEPTVLAGGETITVSIDEFINHSSHFRIAIAPSDAEFVDPSDYDDDYAADNVVMDNIPDVPGERYHDIELLVPDIDCDPCVMQVIQVMYSNNAFSSGSLYWQCADIVIEGSSAATTGEIDTDTVGDDESTDESSGEGDTGMSTTGDTASQDTDIPRPGGTEATDGSTGAADSEGQGGCGCRSMPAGGEPAWLLGMGLVALLRRRRP